MRSRTCRPSLLPALPWAVLWAALLPGLHPAAAQPNRGGPFREVVLRVDTSVFSLTKNTVNTGGAQQLYFWYEDVDAVCEVELYPYFPAAIRQINLLPSADFSLMRGPGGTRAKGRPEQVEVKIQGEGLHKIGGHATFSVSEKQAGGLNNTFFHTFEISNGYLSLKFYTNEWTTRTTN